MKRIIFLLVLLTSFFVFACGGGSSSGGLQAPAYNMSGTWSVTETSGTNTCYDPVGVVDTYTITAAQAQGSNSISMTNISTAETVTVTMSGTSITYSGQGPSTGCTNLSESWKFTADLASSISGTVNWTCQYTGGSCTGTDTVIATKAAPTISGFNPTSGPVGTTVTITGTNFSATAANNTVKFNGTTATVTNSTATSITTSVPNGATTGTISVMVSGQTATSLATFTVTGGGGGSAPTISGFNPTSGPVGTTVTITGTNFSATAANNTVKFNGTTATVTNSTTTSITTSVPNGATTGPITVTVGGLTGTSAAFMVTGGGGTAEVEPNDSSTNAQVISVNQTINGTTSGNYQAGTDDPDWYKITPSTGYYTIKVTFPSTCDLGLFLYNSTVTTLLSYSDAVANGGSETITYTLVNGQTYYILVDAWSCTTTSAYTLIVQ